MVKWNITVIDDIKQTVFLIESSLVISSLCIYILAWTPPPPHAAYNACLFWSFTTTNLVLQELK